MTLIDKIIKNGRVNPFTYPGLGLLLTIMIISAVGIILS